MAGLLPALIVGGVGAAAGVASSYQQARSQNAQMKGGYAAQVRAVDIQNRMIRDQESLEQKKIRTQANLIRARIRVTGGEAGIGTGGTFEALLRQADYDEALNVAISRKNTANAFEAASGGVQPLGGQSFSPFLSGLSTGLEGFSTGLQIGSVLKKG